ncbi:hypothetical protein BKA56DRAFT_335060 [Ilyonectria sp. MPI-CAGE-AT-0026]|nr:hypothetical protein BKA56DRAFT_335060 [Ilyonectria sp. MPI-CAGE-AT-0026]
MKDTPQILTPHSLSETRPCWPVFGLLGLVFGVMPINRRHIWDRRLRRGSSAIIVLFLSVHLFVAICLLVWSIMGFRMHVDGVGRWRQNGNQYVSIWRLAQEV